MHKKDINNSSQNILTPTMEDYLEAIFNLAKEKGAVRVRDIAKRLGVKMPAVSAPTLERFVDFMIFIKDCSPGRNDWLERFDQYREHEQPKDKGLRQRLKKSAHENNVQIKETGMGRER